MPNAVIILASVQDEHACAVHYALKMLGSDPHIYLPTEILGAGDISVAYQPGAVSLQLGSFSGALDEVSSSWNRRLSQTFREPAFVHPADRDHLVYAAHSITRGVAALLDQRFPVNSLRSSVITSNKLTQLKSAQESGFRTPRTLISSNPDHVQAFIRSEKTACVKPYTMYSWVTSEGIKASTTAIITDPMEFAPDSVALVPNIYQEYIHKVCEYRVTLFGGFVATTKINSQDTDGSKMDWRADTSYLDSLEPAILPDEIIESLRQIMRSLGLRFGTFDIAEDSNGEYVFFEVNEAGQWLWQELYSPDCYILEAFAEYLKAGRDDFQWSSSRDRPNIRAAEVMALVAESSVYSSIMTQHDETQTDETEDRLLLADRQR